MYEELFEPWYVEKIEKLYSAFGLTFYHIEGSLEEEEETDYAEWLLIANEKGEPLFTLAIARTSEGTEIEPVPLIEIWKLRALIDRLRRKTKMKLTPRKVEAFWDPSYDMEIVTGKKYLDVLLRRKGKKEKERIFFFRTTRKDAELIELLYEIAELRNEVVDIYIDDYLL